MEHQEVLDKVKELFTSADELKEYSLFHEYKKQITHSSLDKEARHDRGIAEISPVRSGSFRVDYKGRVRIQAREKRTSFVQIDITKPFTPEVIAKVREFLEFQLAVRIQAILEADKRKVLEEQRQETEAEFVKQSKVPLVRQSEYSRDYKPVGVDATININLDNVHFRGLKCSHEQANRILAILTENVKVTPEAVETELGEF